MKSLTKVELDSLLAVALKHSEADWLMLRLTFNHGLRVGELLALTKANIVDGMIVAKSEKNSNPLRQPILPNEQDALLRRIAAAGEGPLFPCYGRKYVWRMMHRYGKEAGVPAYKLHPHALRHTTGRLSYEAGIGIPEIVQIMRHKNPKNSLIYMEATPEQAYAAFAAAVGK